MRTTQAQFTKPDKNKMLSAKLSEAAKIRPLKERDTIGKRPDSTAKIDRYGWQLKDQPGVFASVPKGSLKVDPRYQRPLNEHKVNNMARDWSWVACGCLVVAVRQGGDLYIVEGQHRHAAALKRSDIRALPCLLFELATLGDEAKGFLDANTLRKPLAMFDRFKALLEAGDKVAIRTEQILKLHNYKLSPQAGPNEGRAIRCVRSLMNCVELDEAALSRIFPLAIKACEGGVIDERILVGLFYLERNCTTSLATPRWEARIAKFRRVDFISAITRTVAAYEKGGNKQWGLGVLMLLNKALQERYMLRLKENT